MESLHRIEALPGQGRYAVTFRRPDGAEQSATVQVQDGGLVAAAASLPADWTGGSPSALALAAAVLAFDQARTAAPSVIELLDVAGGWDVGLGNVVLVGAIPTCTAHGQLSAGPADEWECSECGARAIYAG